MYNGGCNGGLLSATIQYLTQEGVVSDACKPYTSGVGTNGFCSFSCQNLTEAYIKYKCAPNSLKMPTSTEDIQTELMTNGPMQVGFIIYGDFLNYVSGIYHVTDETDIQGGHAVKLIGWNHDSNSRLYWICQNQWGDSWGENGYFRIYAGEAGLDTMATACDPLI